uniref:Uncharacterized protein n=1 Tax=Rousettus aegyptiacus TaxID=9407 RepID=A0A7J8EZS4_ROUAE|nr:hypothetical protein HJG63_012226 [Rousettus aegyptiacus]
MPGRCPRVDERDSRVLSCSGQTWSLLVPCLPGIFSIECAQHVPDLRHWPFSLLLIPQLLKWLGSCGGGRPIMKTVGQVSLGSSAEKVILDPGTRITCLEGLCGWPAPCFMETDLSSHPGPA